MNALFTRRALFAGAACHALLAPPACRLPAPALQPAAVAGSAAAPEPTPTPTWTQQMRATMTLEQKVGQMIMIAFEGTQASEMVRHMIAERHVGGVILFRGNMVSPAQVAALTRELQEIALLSPPGLPLFIATDHEGGIVQRIVEGVTPLPGNMALGATWSEEDVRASAAIAAGELLAMGINVNLAPVVDVNNNARNPVIGVRSFGSQPEQVARWGAITIQTLQERGVVATAKHFPGHGDTTVDSHIALPAIEHSLARLEAVELLPFRAAIQAGVDAIMTAHVTFPALDPQPGLPATLSPRVVTELLRQKLGFQGLIITDDLEMGAIVERYSVPAAAVMALKAGADILLFRYNHDYQAQAIDAILEAVRSGEIPAERIEQSVERILQVKAMRGIVDRAAAPPQDAARLVGQPESLERVRQIGSRAVTLVRDEGGLVPLPQDGRLRVLNPALAEIARAEPLVNDQVTLAAELRRRGVALDESAYTLWATDDEIRRHVQAARAADRLVLATYDLARYPRQRILVEQVLALGKPTIAVALRSPYDLLSYRTVPAYLVTYGYRPALVAAAADILAGRAQPKGRLPVELPELYPAGHGIVR